jgi:hypothetical protein
VGPHARGTAERRDTRGRLAVVPPVAAFLTRRRRGLTPCGVRALPSAGAVTWRRQDRPASPCAGSSSPRCATPLALALRSGRHAHGESWPGERRCLRALQVLELRTCANRPGKEEPLGTAPSARYAITAHIRDEQDEVFRSTAAPESSRGLRRGPGASFSRSQHLAELKALVAERRIDMSAPEPRQACSPDAQASHERDPFATAGRVTPPGMRYPATAGCWRFHVVPCREIRRRSFARGTSENVTSCSTPSIP